MPTTTHRRDFLATCAAAGAGLTLGTLSMSQAAARSACCPLFRISVAEYSLHRMLAAGELDPRDYGPFCKEHFNAEAVEYWMGPYSDKAEDRQYMCEMHCKSVDAGVKELLIMIDGEGDLGAADTAQRIQAIENHYKWVQAAKMMGCHSIRVNARSTGDREEQAKLAADGLRRLSEFAAPYHINIIVENHGGLSSDGKWLAGVIELVGLENCGTLPDFGNFVINRETGEEYDRYQGVQELMPFAKGVSAKSYGFDSEGNESRIDYPRMMKIVVDSGYDGFVGVEWEGENPKSEIEGVLLTKRLLERVRDQLATQSA